jgi:hypothetical protein
VLSENGATKFPQPAVSHRVPAIDLAGSFEEFFGDIETGKGGVGVEDGSVMGNFFFKHRLHCHTLRESSLLDRVLY